VRGGFLKHKPHKLQDGCVRKRFFDLFGKGLEDYECFKRATESLAKATSDSMRARLAGFFVFLGEDPDLVIANRQADLASVDATVNENYERRTKAYLRGLQDRGLAGFTVSSHAGSIQGFFANNGRRLSLDLHKLKISKVRKIRKYSPSNGEVRALFVKADCARDKLLVALMFHTGLNPVDVAALRVGDLPLEPWCFFERSRSKTGEVMRGVVSPDVSECLKTYLAVRGVVDAGSALVVGRQGPLDSQAVSDVLAGLIIRAGFGDVVGFKPTALRDAFEDCLVDANLNHKVKEAFMGHCGDIESQYGGYKRMVTRLVEAYRVVYPFLALQDREVVGGLSEDKLRQVELLLEWFVAGKLKFSG
jgi:integrase